MKGKPVFQCSPFGPQSFVSRSPGLWVSTKEGSRSSPPVCGADPHGSHGEVCGSSLLELHAKREFKLTRPAIPGGITSGSLAIDGACAENVAIIRIARIDVIEHVEGVHAELGGHALPNRERLGDRQVGT